MLSQAVMASYTKPVPDDYHKGQLTVTGISPCAYATYLNYHKLDVEERDAASILRMKNGKWQELECLEDLRHAGFKMRYTGDHQMIVHVGKARIGGRPDGLIFVDNREDVLSIKARSLDLYTAVRQKGIEAEPHTECQEQMYLASEELRDKVGCWVYYKHKDSCRPFDLFVERNDSYSRPIIEAVDEIVVGQADVKRPAEPVPLCARCRHSQFCWGAEILDTSGVQVLSRPGVVNLWMEGQFHLERGKQLNEEARTQIKNFLGSDEVLYLEGDLALLEARRIIQHRSNISEKKFVKRYGAAALAYVTEETEVEQIRITSRD